MLSFRYRRKKKNQTTIKLKFITFSINSNYFALPVKAAIKVIQTDEMEDFSQQENLLFPYKNQKVSVINLASFLFEEESKADLKNLNNHTKTKYFILIENEKKEIFALSINSHPQLLVCEESNIKSIPKQNLKLGNIQSISVNIIETKDHKTLFLLEPELLSFLNKLNI